MYNNNFRIGLYSWAISHTIYREHQKICQIIINTWIISVNIRLYTSHTYTYIWCNIICMQSAVNSYDTCDILGLELSTQSTWHSGKASNCETEYLVSNPARDRNFYNNWKQIKLINFHCHGRSYEWNFPLINRWFVLPNRLLIKGVDSRLKSTVRTKVWRHECVKIRIIAIMIIYIEIHLALLPLTIIVRWAHTFVHSHQRSGLETRSRRKKERLISLFLFIRGFTHIYISILLQ